MPPAGRLVPNGAHLVDKARPGGAFRHPRTSSTSGSRLPVTESPRLSCCQGMTWRALEMTLEILGDSDAVARISESLAALGRGEPGADMATVRQDLARRRVTGT